MGNEFIDIIADDKNLIVYRPKLKKICTSVNSIILLQQIMYWWKISKEKKFYKFKDSCNHKLYKEGDSWCEELGFTKTEFDNALKNIAYKKGKISKTKQFKKQEEAFVIFYTDANRLTWYDINEDLLSKAIKLIYKEKEESESIIENNKVDLQYSKTTSKITTKTTNSFLKKRKDFSNPSYKNNSSSHKSASKRKPLQKSKNNNKTLSPKLIHIMTKQEKEKFYEYQTKAVRLSERDKIKLKIQQQKETDLLKQENKPLQDKNNPKNSEKIIYNTNINNNSNQLIEFWNNLGIIKHQKGKVIEKSIIAIDKYSKDYTEDQIKQSMKQYSIMLSGNGYSRIQDRAPYKVSLPEFFEFDDFTLKRINKSNGDRTILNRVKSWFIECLNDENYLKEKYSVIAKDKYPEITKEIKKAWNKFLYEWDGRYEEMKEEGQYTALEENIYRKISRRLVEFFEANKNELKADDALELTQWFESCVTEIENSEYQLGFLAGDIFWGNQFINYLKDCGDMGERTYTQKEMMALSAKERKQMDDDNDEDTNYSYLYEGMQSDVTIYDLAY